MFKATKVFMYVLMIPLAFACAQEGDEVGTTEDPADDETTIIDEPTDDAWGDGADAAVEFDLDAVNESGVTGNVTLDSSNGAKILTIELEGAQPAMEYTAHVHRGTCDNDMGVVVPLNSFNDDGSGIVVSETTLEGTELLPDEEYFVQAHSGDGSPIACAGLPADAISADGTMDGGIDGEDTTL